MVDFISSMEEAFGVVVPIPALPVEGNVFVCGYALCLIEIADKKNINTKRV